MGAKGKNFSGAVNYPVHAGLLGREREPGARKDSYRVYDPDVWSAITRQRQEVMERWVAFLAEGVEMLDQARPGARRIQETLAYYRLMCDEIPQVMQRWRAHRRELFESAHFRDGPELSRAPAGFPRPSGHARKAG